MIDRLLKAVGRLLGGQELVTVVLSYHDKRVNNGDPLLGRWRRLDIRCCELPVQMDQSFLWSLLFKQFTLFPLKIGLAQGLTIFRSADIALQLLQIA